MRSVVYLIEQPLDQRNYVRFGIDSWLQRGWRVEVWDLTPMSHPTVWRDFLARGGELKKTDVYFSLASMGDVLERLATGPFGFFVDYTGDDVVSARIKRELVGGGAKRIVSSSGSLPSAARTSSWGSKIAQVFSQNPMRSLKRLQSMIVRRRFRGTLKPKVVIVSGEESLAGMRGDGSAAVVKAHNFDYDIYLELVHTSPSQQDGRVVFIDQDFCFHRDFLYLGLRPPVTPARYFPAIRRTLREIATAVGADPVVCAHPRSSYGLMGEEYFGEIPLESGNTAQLIRDAKVVVCHYSTAVQFAVLFRKPVIFLTTDEVEATSWGATVSAFAAALGKVPINIDRVGDRMDWSAVLTMDEAKYDEYRRRYIKLPESPELPHWHLVIDALEGMETLR